MKQRFSKLKASVYRSSRRSMTPGGVQDRHSPLLDNARNIFQLVSNLGSGALNIPGLQAAGLIGVQIVDIIKVKNFYLLPDILLTPFPIENTRKQGRL
jgi:hypothetical protein